MDMWRGRERETSAAEVSSADVRYSVPMPFSWQCNVVPVAVCIVKSRGFPLCATAFAIDRHVNFKNYENILIRVLIREVHPIPIESHTT